MLKKYNWKRSPIDIVQEKIPPGGFGGFAYYILYYVFTAYTLAPELLKVEYVQMHICAIFLKFCAKFVLLNAKPEKNALFPDFGTI